MKPKTAKAGGSTGDVRKAAKKTYKWLSTPEGRKALREVVEQGTPLSDQLYEAREIDPEELRKPTGF